MTRVDARAIACAALERALRTARGGSQAEEDCIADAILAAVAEAETRAATLFDAIAHGDEAHRAWLKKAIEDHFAGRAVERPAGVGRTEAAVTERDKAWREWLTRRFRDEWISTCGDLPDRQPAPPEKADG
jgi:hypothetical protein